MRTHPLTVELVMRHPEPGPRHLIALVAEALGPEEGHLALLAQFTADVVGHFAVGHEGVEKLLGDLVAGKGREVMERGGVR